MNSQAETEDLQERAMRLEEILVEMKELLFEAKELTEGTNCEDRAKAYWVGHIAMALDDDHSYLGSVSCTLQDTINELTEDDEDNEENEA